jgi:hypothetical protein
MADPDAPGPAAEAPAEPEWIALLRAEARVRTISAVARQVGMKRPSLSMLLAGTYPAASLAGVTRRHEAEVLRVLRDRVPCPHLRRGIGRAECEGYARAPMSASDPARLRHWAACRACPLNPIRAGGQA